MGDVPPVPTATSDSLFAKLFSQRSDFANPIPMADEAPREARLINPDLQEKLRQRQLAMSTTLRGDTNGAPVIPRTQRDAAPPLKKAGKKTNTTITISSDEERFSGPRRGRNQKRPITVRSTSSSSSSSSSVARTKPSSSSTNESPETGPSESSSSTSSSSSSGHSSSSSSSTTATGSGSTSSSAPVAYNVNVDMRDDYYGFASPPKGQPMMNGSQAESRQYLLGPEVQLSLPGGDALSVDLHLQKLLNITYGDGTEGPLIVPLWAEHRYRTTGTLYCKTNASIALHQEIMDFVDWMRPTEAELVMRRLVEMQLSRIAKDLWPSCEPCAYGSIATQLLIPTSDVDMTVLNVPVSTEDALLALCRKITSEELGVSAMPKMILNTKVPLLKFATRLGGIEVDVSVNAADGKTSSETVNRLLKRFPVARPLIVVIKHFLASREMNEPFKGTLGSFATTCIVIAFLQQHPIYTTHQHLRAEYGLGKLLVDFFRYYAVCFNYVNVAISLENGGSCFPRTNTLTSDGPRGPAQVIVEDPSNPTNNVASSLRFFQNIRSAFDGAYQSLTGPPGATVHDRPLDPRLVNATSPLISMRPTLLSRILHIDEGLLKRRENAEVALKDFESKFPADFVAAVKSFKRQDDAPMLSHTVLAPVSDPNALLRNLRSKPPALRDTIFCPPGSRSLQPSAPKDRHVSHHDHSGGRTEHHIGSRTTARSTQQQQPPPLQPRRVHEQAPPLQPRRGHEQAPPLQPRRGHEQRGHYEAPYQPRRSQPPPPPPPPPPVPGVPPPPLPGIRSLPNRRRRTAADASSTSSDDVSQRWKRSFVSKTRGF